MKERTAWRRMIQRCTNPKDKNYKTYGGRGIKVCDRWMKSFDTFFEDIGSAPSEDLTIDRINNNGNYEPNNCRWATRKQQSNNKRDNVIIRFNGQSKTLAEWAEAFGMKYHTVYRLHLRGYELREAFEQRL